MAFLLPIAVEIATSGAAGASFAAGWYGVKTFFKKDDMPKEKEQPMDRNKANPMAAEKVQPMESKSAAELKELVQKLTKENEQMKEQMKKQMKEPPNEDAAFDRFLAGLADVDLTPWYPKHPNIFRIGFIGKVSVGKSSLINALYGEKVAKTGRGATTMKPAFLGEMKLTKAATRKTHIYDIPGDDSNYSYVDVEGLRMVNSLDLLVVVFDDTISYTVNFIKLAMTLGKYIVFVRNKLDGDDNDEDDDSKELSWQEELEKDKEKLDQMLPTSVPFPMFGVSAKNSLKAVKAALKSGNTAAPAPCETYQWNAFVKELAMLSEAGGNVSSLAGGEVCHNDIRDRP